MSLVTELRGAVIDARKRIDDQCMKLHGFQSQLDSALQKVNASFQGSTLDYGQEMIDRLTQTKQQVTETISLLEEAKNQLLTMSII